MPQSETCFLLFSFFFKEKKWMYPRAAKGNALINQMLLWKKQSTEFFLLALLLLDCGALKTADVGISISDTEASIAAPFTSKIQDISCVIKLLREGRCALVTSFHCFKYMALYSMIQFGETTLLYFMLSKPSDMMFLYCDLFLIIPMAFLMGLTHSQKILSKKIPDSNLISFNVLLSVIGQTII